ncbi:MAG: glycosyltransferase family 9 protein [Phycisphaerales bacterium]|nr:glycosyltransferase family 9 protein [Phycisphaerales bacterium]
MNDPQRILLIRPSALGDVCRSVSVLAALKKRFPNAQIDWMVQDSFYEAIVHHPALNNYIPFPRKKLGEQCRKGRFGGLFKWLKELKQSKYDMVIDAQGLARSGFFTWYTRAPRRIGYRDAQENSWIFLNQRVEAPISLHSVDRMLKLVESVGCETSEPDMQLYCGQDELSQAIIEYPDRYAVIAPTSRWPAKCWPIERFTELTERLIKLPEIDRVVVVGGPGERLSCAPLLELAETHPFITDRVGSTNISQLMAIISRAQLVVANDSAAIHMAVGFKRKLVALLGPTDPKLVGPYLHDEDVIQHQLPDDNFHFRSPESVIMMERIGTDEVFNACVDRVRI